MTFDSTSRSFLISLPGFPRIAFAPEATLDGKKITRLSWRADNKTEGVFLAKSAEGEWSLRLDGKNGAIQVVLEARLKKTPKRLELRPLVFSKIPADHVLAHGRKMGGCEAHVLTRGTKELISHGWTAITRGGYTLHLSHSLRQKQVSHFAGRIRGKSVEGLAAATLFDLPSGKRFSAAPVTLAASPDGHELLVNWAEGQREGHKPVTVPQESGWNSWDYYRWTITEEEVYKNAELIAGDPVLRKHVRRIIVDDGWQYCYGEWEPNCFFPSGMKKLAQNLKRMGFTPGLWFAPTIAELHSRFAQLEPEVLATGLSGFPALAFSCMERKGFLLDPTHPRVRAWWDELFRRYAGYGYRYFKLDFMAFTVASRRFHDRNATPGDLMRRIVEPIRNAVGPESRILGCNFNFNGGPGLVDDVRISADIHSRWLSVKENVSSIAARFWSHERLWVNDPDFLLCRGEDTSDDPHLHRLKALLPFVRPDDLNETGFDYMDSLVDLSYREAEVLASLVIAAGGAMNLSDRLTRLNKRGLAMLRRAVQAEKGAAAVPLDLFRSQYPSCWVQRLASGLHRVLLVNWEEGAVSVELDLAKLNVPHRQLRNFWTDESVPIKGGRLAAKLPPHACLFIETR